MGVWSTEILGNDISSDVFDKFVELFKKKGADVATRQMEKEIENTQDDEKGFFLSALIYAEWKCNAVNNAHLQKLISIRKNAEFGMEWHDKKEREQWIGTVDKLVDFCLSGEKPNNPIKQSKHIDTSVVTKWNLWDVYAYRLSTALSKECGIYGKYMVLQKIGETQSGDEVNPTCDIIRIVAHVFDELEDCLNFRNYTLLPTLPRDVLDHFFYTFDDKQFNTFVSRSLHNSMYMFEQCEYPSKKLTYLINDPSAFMFDLIYNEDNGCLVYADNFWKGFERHSLINQFKEWKDKEGVLKYYYGRMMGDSRP